MLRFEPTTPPELRVRVAVVLLAAVVSMGMSAVLVRGMEADPLAIAAWRTLASALVLAPWLRGAPRPTAREAGMLLVAGIALAAHFALWFASLGMTTVLRSTVLVCLTPVWTGLLEIAVDRTVPPGRFWVGTAVALLGVGVMSGGSLAGGSLTGDALAVLAGALWPMYLLLGRGYRRRAGTVPAMAVVCAAAALVLWPVAAAAGVTLTGYPLQTWLLLVLAVALPQLVGHQGMSWAMVYVAPSTVAAATLLEPPVAAALSALVFRELPTWPQVAGSAVVLAGVGLSLRSR